MCIKTKIASNYGKQNCAHVVFRINLIRLWLPFAAAQGTIRGLRDRVVMCQPMVPTNLWFSAFFYLTLRNTTKSRIR